MRGEKRLRRGRRVNEGETARHGHTALSGRCDILGVPATRYDSKDLGAPAVCGGPGHAPVPVDDGSRRNSAGKVQPEHVRHSRGGGVQPPPLQQVGSV
jgi:hypothetical protein